jgi:EAL domain-containing protein (putative c-di-GMP-specific phosphodiesterase class I)
VGVAPEREVAALARRFLSEFEKPFAVGRTQRRVSGSLEMSIARAGGGATPIELLRDADTAMYRAKTSGKARFDVFDADLRQELLRPVGLGASLEQALRNRQLELGYRPIVSVDDGQPMAVEAIVRWTDGRWGSVSPAEFVPLAEENGLIVPLGRFVLGEAAWQIARRRLEVPEALPFGILVNISPRELGEPGYATHVAATLAEHGLSSADLALELTERAFIDESNTTVNDNLTEITQNGIRLVLDDFGTGYSALASLKRFPLAAVKIDRYFIDAIRSAESPAPITRAVVSLGHTLGMRVIAEGIESQVQLDYLRRLGCDAAQGYLLGRPQAQARSPPWSRPASCASDACETTRRNVARRLPNRGRPCGRSSNAGTCRTIDGLPSRVHDNQSGGRPRRAQRRVQVLMKLCRAVG